MASSFNCGRKKICMWKVITKSNSPNVPWEIVQLPNCQTMAFSFCNDTSKHTKFKGQKQEHKWESDTSKNKKEFFSFSFSFFFKKKRKKERTCYSVCIFFSLHTCICIYTQYIHVYVYIDFITKYNTCTCNRAEPSQTLGFQDWLIYENAYSSRAQVQAEVRNVCSSLAHWKLGRAQAHWECHSSWAKYSTSLS